MSYKDWIVIVLTVVFVGGYLGALFGWLTPPSDDKLVVQLAPIVSVIIGYYFGRIPGEKAEQQRDRAQNERDRAVEKIRDAKVALRTAAPTVPPGQLAATLGGSSPSGLDSDAVRRAAATALNALEAD